MKIIFTNLAYFILLFDQLKKKADIINNCLSVFLCLLNLPFWELTLFSPRLRKSFVNLILYILPKFMKPLQKLFQICVILKRLSIRRLLLKKQIIDKTEVIQIMTLAIFASYFRRLSPWKIGKPRNNLKFSRWRNLNVCSN